MTTRFRAALLLLVVSSFLQAGPCPFRASWLSKDGRLIEDGKQPPSHEQAIRKAFLAQFDGRPWSTELANFSKYNQSKVLKAKLSLEAINNLTAADARIKGPPRFIADLLDMKPSVHREMLKKRPELIAFTDDEQFVLMPNPRHVDYVSLLVDPKGAKHQRRGMGLVVWYLHPALYQGSRLQERDSVLADLEASGESLRYGRLESKDNVESLLGIQGFSWLQERRPEALAVADLVQSSGIPYLSGPFDLEPEHLEVLKELRSLINKQLTEIYGIDASDRVEMYFHTHYHPDTTTMHLHVRVNQYHHGLELNKAISLDEVIATLEAGHTVKQDFLKHEYIHHKLSFYDMLDELGYELEIVDNPYKLELAQSAASSPGHSPGIETQLKYVINNLEELPEDLSLAMQGGQAHPQINKRGYVLQEYVPVSDENLAAFVYAMNQTGIGFGSASQQAEFFQESLSFVKEIRMMTKYIMAKDGTIACSRQATIKSEGGLRRKVLEHSPQLSSIQQERLAQVFERFRPSVTFRVLKANHEIEFPLGDAETVPLDIDIFLEEGGPELRPFLITGEVKVSGPRALQRAQDLECKLSSCSLLVEDVSDLSELRSHSVAMAGVPADVKEDLKTHNDYNSTFTHRMRQAWTALGITQPIRRTGPLGRRVPPAAFKKYNTPIVTAYRFKNRGALQRARERYKTLKVCDIVTDTFLLSDPYMDPIMPQLAKFSRWTSDKRFCLIPNPKTIPQDPLYITHPELWPSNPNGLSLIAWYAHPDIYELSAWKHGRAPDQAEELLRGRVIETLSQQTPYLSTILDLRPEDLPTLVELRALALSFLQETFSVDPEKDNVEMYIHFPYPQRTTTLHVHIRVNQLHHPMEWSRTVWLDEIIDAFEHGQEIDDVILARQKSSKFNAFVGLPVAVDILDGIAGLEMDSVANPYHVPET